jgi:transcription elongation factor Elf1
MGRRRRRVVRFPKKKLPTVFDCPKCGKATVHVELDKVKKTARVKCGNADCQLGDEVPITPASSPIDAYCHFVDNYYSQPTPRQVEEKT